MAYIVCYGHHKTTRYEDPVSTKTVTYYTVVRNCHSVTCHSQRLQKPHFTSLNKTEYCYEASVKILTNLQHVDNSVVPDDADSSTPTHSVIGHVSVCTHVIYVLRKCPESHLQHTAALCTYLLVMKHKNYLNSASRMAAKNSQPYKCSVQQADNIQYTQITYSGIKHKLCQIIKTSCIELEHF